MFVVRWIGAVTVGETLGFAVAASVGAAAKGEAVHESPRETHANRRDTWVIQLGVGLFPLAVDCICLKTSTLSSRAAVFVVALLPPNPRGARPVRPDSEAPFSPWLAPGGGGPSA